MLVPLHYATTQVWSLQVFGSWRGRVGNSAFCPWIAMIVFRMRGPGSREREEFEELRLPTPQEEISESDGVPDPDPEETRTGSHVVVIDIS